MVEQDVVPAFGYGTAATSVAARPVDPVTGAPLSPWAAGAGR